MPTSRPRLTGNDGLAIDPVALGGSFAHLLPGSLMSRAAARESATLTGEGSGAAPGARGPTDEAPLVRVMGIDPGSVVTGYGVIDSDGARSFHVAHGHIRVKGASFAERLGHIHRALGEVIAEWRPSEVAIEQVFLSNNAMSALKLGQARGAAITAVVSRSIPVSEYAARAVKQVVTGAGSADKGQVQAMVKALLHVEEALQADAADGLAIAICHAHSRVGRRRGADAGVSPRRRSRGRGLRL